VRWAQNNFFTAACLFESSFLLLSVLISIGSESPWWHGCAFDGKSVFWACGGSLFLLGLFFGSLRLEWQSLARIQKFLNEVAGPHFRSLSGWRLALISIIAGVAEEALFRGTIQHYAASEWGTVVELLIGSLVFGLAHWVTLAYAVLAAIIGFYLGWLYWATGNIGVPMMVHAFYDFGVLTYYYGFKRPPSYLP